MSNDFFTNFNRLARNALARADGVNAIFDSVVAAFDKMPSYARLRGGAANYATDSGTAGAFVLALTGVDALFEGLTVRWKAAAANTGACSINLNSFGVVSFVMPTGEAFTAGAIPAGGIVEATYDGTVWRGAVTDSATNRAAAAASAAAAAASASAASTSAGTASSASAAAVVARNAVDAVWYGSLSAAPGGAAEGAMYLNTSDTPNTVYVLTETGWSPVVTISVGGLRRQEFTSVTGTGPFTISGGYDLGDLYKNGSLLNKSVDWFENTAAGTFTLNVAAISSDVFSFRGYLQNDLTDIYTKAESDDRYLNKTDAAAARTVLSVPSNAELAAAVLAANPVGERREFFLSAAPTGFLKANGAAVLISSYSALATAIYCGSGANGTAEWGYKCTNPANPTGTRSTSGTYIVLPDCRGRFGRALDDSAGIDIGRTLWSYQADDNKAHTHTGTTDSAGDHAHTTWFEDENYDGSGSVTSMKRPLDSASGADRNGTTSTAGAHTHPFTTGSSGSESRPKNYAALVCIKYQ